MLTMVPLICNIVVQVVRNWIRGALVFNSGVSQGLMESALMFAPHGGQLNFLDPLVMTCTTIIGVVMWLQAVAKAQQSCCDPASVLHIILTMIMNQDHPYFQKQRLILISYMHDESGWPAQKVALSCAEGYKSGQHLITGKFTGLGVWCNDELNLLQGRRLHKASHKIWNLRPRRARMCQCSWTSRQGRSLRRRPHSAPGQETLISMYRFIYFTSQIMAKKQSTISFTRQGICNVYPHPHSGISVSRFPRHCHS